ncbi:MAG: glutamyl-tRNA reductase [Phycisphaerales bacterium]|nr:glutamyl-tRNA reductase [Phycisphaerales bacterium]MCB9862415.1 glutamyl-tRNA reductase [Phycisphaerales bacterium]
MTASIHAISISHRTASLDMRERLAIDDDVAATTLNTIARVHGEAVLVRTCGRLELYVATNRRLDLLPAFASVLGVSVDDLRPVARILNESHAVGHLLSVAAGLQSPIPGEHHILGQVRNAMAFSQRAKAAGPLLSSLFRTAICCGKRVRNETSICRLAHTYASAALAGLQPHLAASSQILIVGSGTLANELSHGLTASGHRNIAIASRHRNRGQALADAIGAVWNSIDSLPECIRHADIVVCCTSSRTPVIGLNAIPNERRSRVILDLGMPRNVDSRITHIPDVTLINLEQLTGGLSIADGCIKAARRIINEEQSRFAAWLSRRRAYYGGAVSRLSSRGPDRNEAAA